MKKLKMLAYVLVLVGALNWGLVGLFNFDLVATLFSSLPSVARLVYALVGLSALVMLAGHKKGCAGCNC